MRIRPTLTSRLALAVVLGASLMWILPPSVPFRVTTEGAGTIRSQAWGSTAYVLERDSWLSFPLPPTELVRIVTNATVPARRGADDDYECPYAIEYQILADGESIGAGTYAFRGRETTFLDPATDTVRPVGFYYQSPLQPLSARECVVNLTDVEADPTMLKIRLRDIDPTAVDAVVRVYHRAPVAQFKLETLWRELSPVKRRRLARGNVYDLRLLTDPERENLLRNRWSPLAPLEFEISHQRRRRIYTWKSAESADAADGIIPRGLFLQPATRGVIQVPDPGGVVRLEVERTESTLVPTEVAGAKVRWMGDHGTDSLLRSITVRRGPLMIDTHRYGPGHLEIEVASPSVVNAYLVEAREDRDLTPPPRPLRSYLLSTEAPVDYAVVSQFADYATYRIDLRRLGESGEPAHVALQALDAKGLVIQEAHAIVDGRPSAYDSVVRGETAPVSDATRVYFSPYKGTGALRVLARNDTACAVTVFSRPNSFPRRAIVPRRNLDPELSGNWFLVRPTNHRQCAAESREWLLAVQSRPPALAKEESGPETAAGPDPQRKILRLDCEREAVRLLARSQSLPDGRASPYRFGRIAVGQSVLVNAARFVDSLEQRLSIVYLNPHRRGGSARILVDGTLFYTAPTLRESGELSLPPLPAGEHTVRIDAPGTTEWFLGGAVTNGGPLYLPRSVYRAGTDKLRYRVRKSTQAALLVSGRLYAEPDTQHELKIRLTPVRRKRGSFHTTWTASEVVLDIAVGRHSTVPVVNGAIATLSESGAFGLTLGDDLIAGEYSIEIQKESEAECYVYLSAVDQGQTGERRVIFESRRFDDDAARKE